MERGELDEDKRLALEEWRQYRWYFLLALSAIGLSPYWCS